MAFTLSESQQRVVDHRGSHLQVIACAGSGKTESISRRVAALIVEGVTPRSIVAFTFTEKAAAELKARIVARVRDRMGLEFLGKLGPMFVGTIHSYAFRILQDHVPEYGNHDVIDEHRLAGLLSREHGRLGLRRLGDKHWKPIHEFVRSADVVGNELVDYARIEGTPFGDCYADFEEMLSRYHLLTFQQLISQAVKALEDPAIFRSVHAPLRHLLVDEYQDVNPAQERLVSLLAADPVELCVVGDDDQAIYEWRGSDVRNIVEFRDRYPSSRSINLATNRRSRPGIIAAANTVIQAVGDRLPKSMLPGRNSDGPEVVSWAAVTEAEEAARIGDTIARLEGTGYHLADIGVLFRSVRTSAKPLLDALDGRGIPYFCGGRTGLFLQPEVALFGEVFAWIADRQWKDKRFGRLRDPDIRRVADGMARLFPHAPTAESLLKFLKDWKRFRHRASRPVSLVGDFYKMLEMLRASDIDVNSPRGSAQFGALARFSNVLGDFEHVNRRAGWLERGNGRWWSAGRNRGKAYFQALANYLVHYAHDAYEDFEGEAAAAVNAVSVMTVHQAKGLEWPVVFLPGLVKRRFPSSMTGRSQKWLLNDDAFPPEKRRRYEGSLDEERRLFYVALTRARDCVYLSRFKRKRQRFKPSPFLAGIDEATTSSVEGLALPSPPRASERSSPPELLLSFSDAATFSGCGYRYRLGVTFGYQTELAVELGYGRAIHHVIRLVAEIAKDTGVIPNRHQARALVHGALYLPFADPAARDRMENAAMGLVLRYLSDYSDDLRRVWAIERPFELHLADGTVSGRADVILDEEDGQPGALAVVDYKVATAPDRDVSYHRQLAVYSAAGRAEGLDVVAAYLHDLGGGVRKEVDITPSRAQNEVAAIGRDVLSIRRGSFPPKPSREACGSCDYRLLCKYRAC